MELENPFDIERVAELIANPRTNVHQYRIFSFGYCARCRKITQYRGIYGPEGCWEKCFSCDFSHESGKGSFLTESEASIFLRSPLKKLHSRRMQMRFLEEYLKDKRSELMRKVEAINHVISELNKINSSGSAKRKRVSRRELKSGLIQRRSFPRRFLFPAKDVIEGQEKAGRLHPTSSIQIEHPLDKSLLMFQFHVFLLHKNYRYTPFGRLSLGKNQLILFLRFLESFSRKRDIVLPSPNTHNDDSDVRIGMVEVWQLQYGEFLRAFRLLQSNTRKFKEILNSSKTIEDFIALAVLV